MRIELSGIPETLLWPLYCRAAEAARPDSVLPDPLAVRVAGSIEYPFAQNFGRPQLALALRALTFDAEISAFLRTHPDGTVVALGEGLETQFWRTDNGRLRWLSVDLSESIDARRRLLPAEDERRRSLVCSALDERWMDQVDDSGGVFITAQGLFYYLKRADVMSLIRACARRFTGGRLMFDSMPPWLIRKTSDGTWLSRLMMRGAERAGSTYRLPPMLWGATVDGLRRDIPREIPDVVEVRDVRYPKGRGVMFALVNPHFGSSPIGRNARPSNTLIRFGHEGGASGTSGA